MAVMPVRPPSRMPEADSTNTVHGEEPSSELTTIAAPSQLKANMERSHDLSSLMKPGTYRLMKLAMEKRVPARW